MLSVHIYHETYDGQAVLERVRQALAHIEAYRQELRYYTVLYDAPHRAVHLDTTQHIRLRLWTPGRLFVHEEESFAKDCLSQLHKALQNGCPYQIIEEPCEYMLDRWGGQAGFAIVADIFDISTRVGFAHQDFIRQLVAGTVPQNPADAEEFSTLMEIAGGTWGILSLLHATPLNKAQKLDLLARSADRFVRFTRENGSPEPLAPHERKKTAGEVWAELCHVFDLYNCYVNLLNNEDFKEDIQSVADNLQNLQALMGVRLVQRTHAFLYPFCVATEQSDNQLLNFIADILHFHLNRCGLNNAMEFYAYLAAYAALDEI